MKTLVIGYGSIGKRHVQNLRTLFPHSQILVCVRDVKKCRDGLAAQAENIHFLDSVDAAIRERPKFAIVANPAPYHLEYAIKIARAGVHLFIEKPLSHSLDGIDQLIAECVSNSVQLNIGYNLRFAPSLQFFRDRIISGTVGEIYSIRAEVGQYLPSWRSDRDYRQAVSARKKLGGGVLLELSHEIDYLLWILGDVTEVTAKVAKTSNMDIDVEDTALLCLQAKASPGFGKPLVFLEMDMVRHDRTRKCLVIGKHGSMCWDAITDSVTLLTEGSDIWQMIYRGDRQLHETYLAEIKAFVNTIDGCALQDNVSATAAQAKRVLEVTNAARMSAELGKTMRMEPTS